MELTEYELFQIEEADEHGVRLEMMAGQPFWEFQPNYRHQNRVGGIYKSVRPVPGLDRRCGCVAAMDVGIRFPDDSLRRPDLTIFCQEPEPIVLITLIPEAVVEIVSQRSREKDLVTSPPWYLGMGVKDVLVFDPFSDEVHHFRADGMQRFPSGRTVRLECGCLVDV